MGRTVANKKEIAENRVLEILNVSHRPRKDLLDIITVKERIVSKTYLKDILREMVPTRICSEILPGVGNPVWFFLPDKQHNDKWNKYKRKKLKEKTPAIQQKNLIPPEHIKDHSDEIKRKVITPWMKSLPCVTTYGVGVDCSGANLWPTRNFQNPQYQGYWAEKELHYPEDSILFKDFQNHLAQNLQNPFDQWTTFKERVTTYHNDIQHLKEKIIQWAEEKTGLKYSSQPEKETNYLTDVFLWWLLLKICLVHDKGVAVEWRKYDEAKNKL